MSLPAVITAMLQGDFYPHRPPRVELLQTHISYVLLAGAEVYKVKKAVRFSFLDFSTLERRQHFCREEVRLNRRLAGDVYRGVVAICERDGLYRLGGEDDEGVVEYAVHMRRLPADRMLDWMLEHAQVTGAMIDEIAGRIAAFHGEAGAGAEVTANGAPEAVLAVLEDNYAGVRPFRGDTLSAADDDAIQAFSRDFLAANAARLRGRQRERRIRDGHGDLHSEHLCFRDQGLVIFDCVEFNPRFRYCDVASEIAFLAMDLDYHGRGDLARRLVERYADRARDPEVGYLVPFYQCYRAYVRGKVDSLKSAEEEVAPEERAAARASARRHFALAYGYTWAYSPALVAIVGLSGTGKSVVAAALQERIGFVRLSSDVVRKEIAGPAATAAQPPEYEAGLYSREKSAATYATMLARAGGEIAAGRGVILDATFQRRADRDALRALAAERGVALLVVECRCSEEEVRRRLEQRARRGGSESDADWTVYLEQRKRYEAFAAEERDGHLVVDTEERGEQVTQAIEGALRRRIRGAAGAALPTS